MQVEVDGEVCEEVQNDDSRCNEAGTRGGFWKEARNDPVHGIVDFRIWMQLHAKCMILPNLHWEWKPT